MDPIQEQWYSQAFENRYLKAKRTEFQALVCELLKLRYPTDFVQVRQGTEKGGGDSGCDGYQMSNGTAYAVYAPREDSSSVLANKLRSDHEKCRSFLKDQLKRFRFCHNDEDGLNSDVVLAAVNELRRNHPSISIELMAREVLWEEAKRLTPDQLARLLPAFPGPVARPLSFDIIAPILRHLAQLDPPPDPDITPVSPRKLEFNEIGNAWSLFIRGGRSGSAYVKKYFDRNVDPSYADKVATGFNAEYVRLLGKNLTPKEITDGLFEFAGGYDFAFRTREFQNGIAGVMAYFFDRCDIFQNPPPEANGGLTN